MNAILMVWSIAMGDLRRPYAQEIPIASIKKGKSRGFTLMEILIAIFILALVMASILGTFTGILSSSGNAEKKIELYQTGRALMDLLAADIRGMYPLNMEGAGPFFRGEETTIQDRSFSVMDFVTTHSLSVDPKQVSILAEVGYQIRKNPKGGLFSLWRRSQAPPKFPFDEGGREVPVCRILKSFQLEFFYNDAKRRSLQNTFPQSIVVDFTLELEGERERFVTMVRPLVTIGG